MLTKVVQDGTNHCGRTAISINVGFGTTKKVPLTEHVASWDDMNYAHDE
jgi:hypothetical protein